jgi:hypothetical protein
MIITANFSKVLFEKVKKAWEAGFKNKNKGKKK